MLENRHVLCDLLLALLFLQVLLLEALDSDEVPSELVLGHADLPEGSLAQFVAHAVELVGRHHWLVELMKLVHNHGNQILLVLQ